MNKKILFIIIAILGIESYLFSQDQYHTYEEIIQTINDLSINYPAICKKIDYGFSVEGRELCALKISDNVNDDEPEAEIMFDGGIHGDEIGGAENLVRFAEFLCESYYSDPEITELVNNREIWLYIMVNPDGRVNMTRYNSNGVDLNRDWGFMWDGDGSSPGYYSQPETRALRNCMLENQFVIHTNYHSGTEFLAYPWSYRPDTCPDRAHIHHLAGIYSSSSGYPALPYEQGYTGMYAINGSLKDAAYGVMGSIGWTMEISVNKQPPVSEIQYFYDINKPAMLAMIENAGYGISGMVTDASTGEPVAAAIYINDYYPCHTDPVIGDYHKYLLAGSYSVTAAANGYQSMTQVAGISGNENSILNFALQPEYNHYAYRVMACQVPGSNFADEASTFAALWQPDGERYSLGRAGWIILDMQYIIPDGPGNEIIIHEGDSDPEGYACYASTGIDGPWILVGNGTGTSAFDFAATGITEARYIRITDDGNGDVYGDNMGFDLDAAEVVEPPQEIYLAIDCIITDPTGNNNGRIDPGESFNLLITLQNLGGISMEAGQAYLNIDPQYLTASDANAEIGNLDFGDTVQLSFPMSCHLFCPPEELLMMVLNITSNGGAYLHSFPVNFAAGAIVEDWETANLSKFDWQVSGDRPWAINFSNPYQGTYSAKSGNIDDDEFSAIEVTLDVIGMDDISFYCRVSSEAGSDNLKFYIDNNLLGQWSGEQGWERFSCQVIPGYHTFKWAFEKDNLNTQGADGGWLDYIVFPSSNLDGTMKALANANPHELCFGEQTQLGAYVIGGSGNYNFAWTPADGLNDSTLQYPLAGPGSTTLYFVTVHDEEDTVNSNIEVILHPVPEIPLIYQEGDSLISQSAEGNQWYNFNGPITGETGQVFYPETEGDYFALAMNEYGCLSDTSNIIHFLFTGLAENLTTPAILIYPNPFHHEINIRFIQKPPENISIRIIDIMGKEWVKIKIENADLQDYIDVPAQELKNGLYLFSIIDPDGKILISRKLIKQ